MPKNVSGKAEARKSISISVPYDRQPDETIRLFAYLFGPQGNLLAQAPLKEGRASLDASPGDLAGGRLFIAPEPREPNKPISLDDMQRLQAYEPLIEFQPDRSAYDLLPIPYEIWKFWPLCSCRVRGRVVKPITIFGITFELPVCNARVHICEVDRLIFLIPRLPDWVVWRLRDELLHELQVPRIPRPKLPFPPPPPPDLAISLFPASAQGGLPGPQPREFSQLKAGHPSWFDPQPDPPHDFEGFETSAALERPGDRVSLNPQPLPPKALFNKLPVMAQAGLLSESLEVVRNTLIDQVQIILPYLCLWPWFWPYICLCDELTTLLTDGNGRFDTTIWYSCFGDHPDLYFWVEYPINGSWVSVYHPGICCNTYWNYACGTEVTLRVTDPRVHGCQPDPDLPGKDVIVTTIGEGISMSEIQHPSGVNQGLTIDGRPFAGSLELRMQLSRSNLIGAGVQYYRWSYRRLTQGDGVTAVVDTPHPMMRQVYRSYKILVSGVPQFPMELMGPSASYPRPDIIRIQPAAPTTPGTLGWEVNEPHVDLAYAYFETADLKESGSATPAAGTYELTFELFDGGGNLVNWTAAGIQGFEASNPAPFTPPVGMTTIPAPVNHRITDSGGNVWGFKYVVHVDNNACQGEIFDTLNTTSMHAAGPCGFINFHDRNAENARLSFRAFHPFNFATFRFATVKGSSGYVEVASAGWSGAPAYAPVGVGPVNGFARTVASVFRKDITIAALLDANGVACPAAAFGEDLYVNALATDGYSEADWLDASPVPKAFALAP